MPWYYVLILENCNENELSQESFLLNILVLNYEYPPLGGGAAPVAQQLCELYASHGHKLTVLTMGYKGLPARETTPSGITIIRVPAWRKHQATCETPEMLSYVVSALPRLIRMLRSKQYDIIHTHFIVPTGLLAYLATRIVNIPYVITAHGSDIPGYNNDRFTFEHRFLTPLLRHIANKAASLTAPSLFLKGLIEKNLGIDGVRYIPNGIFPERFSPGVKEKKILMAGRLLPRKGFQHVLEAMKGLDTDFEIHIAGDGPLRETLEDTAGSISVPVVFHGWVPQNSDLLNHLFATASIFCMPSSKENASIALLEAMASEMAVVTSNVSGCPETVGDTGRVVSPGDVEALRTVLHELTQNDDVRVQLGKGARARVEEHFDWHRIGVQFLELFEEVISNKVNKVKT